MELTDICPLSRWETLENDIFELFKFQGSVFNPKGIRIPSFNSSMRRWQRASHQANRTMIASFEISEG